MGIEQRFRTKTQKAGSRYANAKVFRHGSRHGVGGAISNTNSERRQARVKSYSLTLMAG